MTTTRSRPMFPRFDYLTTRPVDQLDQTAARCKLPGACCLRGWIAIGLRCRNSRPVAGRESAFAFSRLGRYRMSLSDTAPLWAASCKLPAVPRAGSLSDFAIGSRPGWAASCQLLPGLDRCRKSPRGGVLDRASADSHQRIGVCLLGCDTTRPEYRMRV